MILVKHVRSTSLNLGFDYLTPEPPGLNRFSTFSISLIFLIDLLKFITPRCSKTRALIWTHQSPFFIFLNPLHEEVRYPKGIKKISSPILFLSVIFSKLKKIIDIRMPGLHINSEGPLSLATTLVDIASSIIEDFKHRNQSSRESVSSSNVGVCSSNIGYRNPYTTSSLRYDCYLFKSLKDTLN